MIEQVEGSDVYIKRLNKPGYKLMDVYRKGKYLMASYEPTVELVISQIPYCKLIKKGGKQNIRVTLYDDNTEVKGFGFETVSCTLSLLINDRAFFVYKECLYLQEQGIKVVFFYDIIKGIEEINKRKDDFPNALKAYYEKEQLMLPENRIPVYLL